MSCDRKRCPQKYGVLPQKERCPEKLVPHQRVTVSRKIGVLPQKERCPEKLVSHQHVMVSHPSAQEKL